MVMTHHRGYLLVWLFAAPHDAELRELMNAKMGFDPDPATMEAKASAASNPEKTPAPGGPPNPEGTAENPAPGGVPTSKAQPAENPAPASDATAFRPSLLKPGEPMPSEKVQAKPLPKGPSQ
jgi:hypothetical protein